MKLAQQQNLFLDPSEFMPQEADRSRAAARFADAAAGAFLDQDLLRAVRGFLAGARGSFGLFASCSLDAHRQFVLAARGQTMSLAFYPRQGVVLWGSEQARALAP